MELNRRIAADHPGLPIVLLGHSLGSFMSKFHLRTRQGARCRSALCLERQAAAYRAGGLLLARLERLRLGQRGRSPLMQALFFGAFNKPFAPARTPFDWLSRDTAEVDKYIADPLCGFDSTVQLYIDILRGVRETAKPSRQARIPKTLPIYVFNGSRDPVSDNIDQLLDAYRTAGLRQVVHKVYSDGRHESLNEINRDVVTRDLIVWLDGVIDRGRHIS